MKEALFYEKLEMRSVMCLLCPHNCRLEEGAYGRCGVRVNIKGSLYSENYELISCLGFDPIEKKPLYHFFPGTVILSIGSLGCNFKCGFCQNYHISQASVTEFTNKASNVQELIINEAHRNPSNIGIAYTYNEPIVWYEYMYDIACNLKNRNLKNVIVSNGYINRVPLDQLLDVADAFNIDIKCFNDNLYKEVAGGSLKPVKYCIKRIRQRGIHIELTHLIVPGFNDNEFEFREMVDWIAGELGNDTVLHLSRYFPAWKFKRPPTSIRLINRFFQIAKEKLHNVYSGNVASGHYGSDTECPDCNRIIIMRSGYKINTSGIDQYGNCRFCGKNVVIIS